MLPISTTQQIKRKHHLIDLTNQVKFSRSVLKVYSNTPAFAFTKQNLTHIVAFAYLGNLCSLHHHERLCKLWKIVADEPLHDLVFVTWLLNGFFKFILIFLNGIYMQQTMKLPYIFVNKSNIRWCYHKITCVSSKVPPRSIINAKHLTKLRKI